MKLSIVICTRNRQAQLAVTLSRLDVGALLAESVELILIDSASDDCTGQVLEDFHKYCTAIVKTKRVATPGLGFARNAGIEISSGDVIIFTDDDCYLGDGYIGHFRRNFDANLYQYGMGQVLRYDQDDDPRIASMKLSHRMILPPHTLLSAGSIQGANMFICRAVFDKAGMFNPHMGAGTSFPCEDIEMATRASLAGFTGVQLPELIVYHHHCKKSGSREATQVLMDYDVGRGAYYASLMHRGHSGVWDLWCRSYPLNAPLASSDADRLSREMRAAASYLDTVRDGSKDNVRWN